MVRKLRILLSSMCAVACLLLVVLWVRSYWRHDVAEGGVPRKGLVGLESGKGNVLVNLSRRTLPAKWKRTSGPIDGIDCGPFEYLDGKSILINHLFCLTANEGHVTLWFPLWLPVLFCGALGVIPWLRWRLSFRNLAVGVVLVAAAVGLVKIAITIR